MVQDIFGTKLKFESVAAEDGYEAQPTRETVIRPRTNIGVALVPERLLWLLPTGDRLTLAADIRDIFKKEDHLFFEDGFRHVFGENLYTHVHLGAEFRYWFLRFRGGAYQGYPSFGLGLDIPILKLDYAFYSRELGRLAGDKKEENHIISLALRFGSGKVEARERIKAAKESQNLRDSNATPTADTPPMDMSTVDTPPASPAP